LAAQWFHFHALLSAQVFCIFGSPVAIYVFGNSGPTPAIPRVTVVG